MVRDAALCETLWPDEVIINNTGGAEITEVIATDASCGNNDGAITITATGGTVPLDYSIDGGLSWSAVNVFTGLTPGTYNIVVRDAALCETLWPDEVIINNIGGAVITEVIATDATCGNNDGTITITATGGTAPLEYSIDGGLNWSASNVFTGLTPGTYNIVVRDAALCETLWPDEVIINNIGGAVITEVIATDATCGNNDGTITITATGGTAPLEYSIDGGLNWSAVNVFTGLTPGTYNIVVRDAALCETLWPDEVIINNTGGAEIMEVIATDASCGNNDGTITITASGGTVPLDYSIDGGLSWSAVHVFTGLTPGAYNIVVRDAALCATLWPDEVIINNIGGAVITEVIATDASCGNNDGTITITATGGTAPLEYSIDGGLNWSAVNVFTGLTPGTYNIVVRDAALCETLWPDEILINNAGGVTITGVMVTDGTCGEASGSISITAVGNMLQFSITNGASWQDDPFFGNLSAGSYTVQVMDAFNCIVVWPDALIIQSEPGPVIVNLEIIDATNGQANGEVNIVANGGLEPLEYQVDNLGWQPVSQFSGLAVGAHTAWVRDANGCIDSRMFIVGNVLVNEVEVSADTVEYCLNFPVVIPVDAENFVDIVEFTVVIRFDPAVLSFVNLINIHPGLAGGVFSYSLSQTLDTLSIRYSIANNSATVPANAELFGLNFAALAPGNSEINWISSQSVIYASAGYAVPRLLINGRALIFPAPDILADGAGTFCEGDSIMLDITSNDAQELAYLWTGPSGFSSTLQDLEFPSLRLSDAGTYTLIATNSDGCPQTIPMTLEVNPKPWLNLAEADTLCAGTPHLLDAGPGYESYLWQDGSVIQSRTESDAGIYTVQVVNSYGCTGESTVWLIPCSLELIMPNAFTPNGDGRNDVFRPVLLGDVTPSRFFMQIYNSWGELIYETNDYGAGWDGTVKGSPAPSSVYVYVITFEVPGYINTTTVNPVRGSISLIR
ncbi:SprB repeat protein [anaerobic digester metagenome]